MAATLASHSCYCREAKLNEGKGKQAFDLCFSRSISLNSFNKFEKSTWSPPSHQHFRLRNEMQHNTSPPRLGTTNGRAVKMVPVNEVVRKKAASANKVETINGKKQVIYGASIVKRSPSPPLVRRTNVTDPRKLPPIEDLKVLPSDEGFSWANENYNSVQRSIDVWSFVISLRVRVFIENAKWTYAGGFSEDKQVEFFPGLLVSSWVTSFLVSFLVFCRLEYCISILLYFSFYLSSLFLFRKKGGKGLPLGCESVCCSLALLLSSLDSSPQLGRIYFLVSMWTSLLSYRYHVSASFSRVLSVHGNLLFLIELLNSCSFSVTRMFRY